MAVDYSVIQSVSFDTKVYNPYNLTVGINAISFDQKKYNPIVNIKSISFDIKKILSFNNPELLRDYPRTTNTDYFDVLQEF